MKGEGEGESTSQVTLTREGITSKSSVLACVNGEGGVPCVSFLFETSCQSWKSKEKHYFLGKIACQHSPPNYTKTLSYSYER